MFSKDLQVLMIGTIKKDVITQNDIVAKYLGKKDGKSNKKNCVYPRQHYTVQEVNSITSNVTLVTSKMTAQDA